jgi:hypothetical protein
LVLLGSLAGGGYLVDGQIVATIGHSYWDSYNVEVRVTLECNNQGPSEAAGMDICPETLSVFTRSRGAHGVTVTGDALSFNDVLGADPRYWTSLYFSENGRRGATSSSNYGCRADTSLCMKRLVCTMKEEFWGMTDHSNQQMVFLDGDDKTKDVEGGDFTPRSHTCVMCAPVPCTDAELSCPNGLVVSSKDTSPQLTSSKKDTNGRPARFNKPECTIGCPQGTWLTCTDEASCAYVAPSQETIDILQSVSQAQLDRAQMTPLLLRALKVLMDKKETEIRRWVQQNKASTGVGGTGGDVPTSFGLGVLVDTCYPCSTAGGLQHFGRRVVTDTGLQTRGFLQFECPGGAFGPQMCAAGEVSQINNETLTSSPCGCMEGRFRDEQGVCMPCWAGHQCPFGATFASGIEACPVDTYSLAGSSACTPGPCGKEAGACATHQALTRCIGAGFQTRDSRCVDCNECVEISGSQTLGAKPCLNLV